MARRLSVAILLGCLWLLVAPSPAHAQGGERIGRYDVAITVDPVGGLQVRETIEYDFGANRRHGIIRELPVRYRYDDVRSGYDRVHRVDVQSVTSPDGAPAQFEVEDSGDRKRIRVGDPDVEITGAHTYEIAYRVEGALNGFDDHDELYWNAIGNEWSVPIDAGEATVDLPGGGPVTQVACFTGPVRSALPCPSATMDGSRAGFSAASLGPGEGLTVVVGFPTGLVPRPMPILDKRWSLADAFSLRPSTVGAAGAVLVAVVGAFSWMAVRTGRDRRFTGSPVDVAFGNVTGDEERVPLFERGETPVEFVPPDDLRPGQVGTLVDEVAHPLDVTATIVDLAVRGYLRIEEVPKEGWFGNADWRLVWLKDDDRLMRYERLLFESLFAGGGTVLLSDLKNTFADDLAEVQDALYEDVVAQGWYRRRPDSTRTAWYVLAGVCLVAAIGVTVLVAAFTEWALVPLALVAGALLLFVAASRMPSRTAKGSAALRRVLGFERFIQESEKDRARFAEQQHLFTEYLPYAVVFGATERWAKAFAGLDGRLPETPFYVSSRPFNVLLFAGAMNDFSVSTAGTLTSTPASSGSSGFGGGGGFSGGGGGGGGGGSW